MPVAEITLAQGALGEDALQGLAREVTDILLRHQGASPDSETARSLMYVEFTEIPRRRSFVGGEPSPAARYRVRVCTPAGSAPAGAKQVLVESVSRAILRAEGTPYSTEEAGRVWCIVEEVPDGNSAMFGKIMRWRDILRHVARADIALRRLRRGSGRMAA